eukprot:CAMPEP_0185207302 /NCGR_PEP_ID=MMETSP1140-20130426/60036_1 /TAXON_ID=298111 /ORGANISM="Pavlova sp., Strain CCMP459" /LENGTH=184 /DNA_ID=CAMNT_0027774983 /DNA_START=457 /DNA_END=1007 /DNA_ORIENTATION=+
MTRCTFSAAEETSVTHHKAKLPSPPQLRRREVCHSGPAVRSHMAAARTERSHASSDFPHEEIHASFGFEVFQVARVPADHHEESTKRDIDGHDRGRGLILLLHPFVYFPVHGILVGVQERGPGVGDVGPWVRHTLLEGRGEGYAHLLVELDRVQVCVHVHHNLHVKVLAAAVEAGNLVKLLALA